MALEKIGVQGIWDNSSYNKGQAEYMAKMLQAENVTGALAGSMSQMGLTTQGAGGFLSMLASSLGMSTAGMVGLGVAVGVGVGAFKMLSGAVGDFIGFMFQGEESAIRVASRVEQLNLIAQTLGQNMGYTGKQVNDLVAALNKEGISLSVGNYLVAQFSRMQLNLAQSTELARVAQDAATISNEGSSDALEGLVYAIQTLNVRMFRTHGILINLEDAYKVYAEKNNLAADSLTTAQKQQAALNAVITSGATIAGAYAASMMTAGKQLGSMTSRIIPDLKAALGAPFQEAFYNIVKGFNDVLDALRTMVSEGGALYPVMVQLGAVFEIVTEPIRNFGATLKNEGGKGLADFATSVAQYITNAFVWGVNLVTNFANGMIQGATNAVVAAINYISGLLSTWFAPGSPPAVAPNIDQWGAATMDEYLNGFTEADFNILKNIQRPLQQVFGSLADMGEISKQAASEMYVSFSEQFIQAMATGNITQALFDQLAQAGSIYGDELADIARKQYELAGASEIYKSAQEALDSAKTKGAADVKAADEAATAARDSYNKVVEDGEKAIEEAQKRRDAAEGAANQGLIEYNQLLRGGASKAQLAAKLKEINAAKQAQAIATQDITAAQAADVVNREAAKQKMDDAETYSKVVKETADAAIAAEQAKADAAKENLSILQAQEALLEEQLQTMLDLTKAQTQVYPTVAPAEAKAAEAPTIPTEGLVKPGGFDPDAIVNPMKDAIDAAVEEMKKKIGEPFAMLHDRAIIAFDAIRRAWYNSGMAENWEKLKKIAGEVWDGIKEKAGEVISIIADWWGTYGGDITFVIGKAIEGLVQIVGGLLPVIVNVFGAIWTVIKGTFKFVLDLVGSVFRLVKDIITGNFKDIPNVFLNIFSAFRDWQKSIISGIVQFINAFLGIFGTSLKAIWDFIVKLFTDIYNWLIGNSWVTDVINGFVKFFEDFIAKVIEWLTSVWNFITTKFDDLKKWLASVSDSIKTHWTTFWDDVKQKATDIWNAITTWVSTKIGEAQTTIGNISTAISDAWTTFWDGVSTKATDIWNTITSWISQKITEISTTIGTINPDTGIIGNIHGAWTTFWDAVSTKVSDIWNGPNGVVATVSNAVNQVIGFFTNAGGTGLLDKIAGLAGNVWNSALSIGTNIVNGIKQGITDAWNALSSGLSNAIDILLRIVRTALGLGSPSKIFAEFGKQIMQGLEVGIDVNARLPKKALMQAIIPIASPAAIPITTGTTNYYQPSINMVNNISNGMSVPYLQSLIIRTVKKGMTA